MRLITGVIPFVCLISLIPSLDARAQQQNLCTSLGFQFHGVMPATEFYESQGLKRSYMANGTIAIPFSGTVQGEINGGFVLFVGLAYSRGYYRSNIYPLDFRTLIYPFDLQSVKPYFYAGVGALYFEVPLDPTLPNVPVDVKRKGFGAYIPIGAGFEIPLSTLVSLDIRGGYNYSQEDHLNYFKYPGDKWYNSDGWASAGVGLKVALGSGEADDDNDGITNSIEEKLRTDPNNPDSDQDGLTDGDELKRFRTNPLAADTDGDGLKDGDEVKIYHTDPLKEDTDNDGIKDGDEVLKYHTNPLVSDTDADKLSDGDEINIYHTDPLLKDTDGDGLDDGREVLTYTTNPLNRDTDGGTIDDGTEVRRGTDPLNPADDVEKKEVHIVLQGITFAAAGIGIDASAEAVLEKTLITLKAFPDIVVEIGGHTNSVGKYADNVTLSLRRAEAVKQWLVARGIDGARLIAKGYGPDNSIASNATSYGRKLNRRIEFTIIK